MRTITTHLQTMILMVLFAFAAVQQADASAKAGEASVYEGSTVTISLADAYKRTLMRSTGVTYQWYSENNSYATVTGSTRYNATVKGIRVTSSCKVYFKCSYFIDGFFRTMDFYYTITVKSTTVSVTRVMLSQSSISLKEGNTYQLSASVYPTNATNKNVNWSSSNTTVATVSNGFVSARAAGTATITCRAADGSGKYATCKVHVEPATIYVSSIALNKTSASLYVGETTQLSASVSPSSATDKSVGWTSDNTSVATVSGGGLVTAKSVGTATITCKAKDGSGKKATCFISVKKEDVEPTAITLSTSKVSLAEGETLQLIATVSPSDAVDKVVTWISDNRVVATVDDNGLVTAKSAGTANIIATTSNNLAAVCRVTVKEESTGEPTQWAGHYKVASSHVESNPTREYIDGFEMTITEKDGIYYITSMFGDDLMTCNDGGFKLYDNGDGTATIDVSYYNILKYTDDDSPLYAIYVFDEAVDDWVDSWTLKMNEDGTISVGDFYVAAFTWVEDEEAWKNGQLEALYYRMTATIDNASGMSEVVVAEESPDIHIENGTIKLDGAAHVAVYKDNGMMVFSGKTNSVDNLPKGLYIVRIGTQSKKILIK